MFAGSNTINGRTFAARKEPRNDRNYNPFTQEEAPDSYSQIDQPTGGGVRRGAKVVHEIFGEGRVIEVTGRGDKAKAVVDFQRQGRKNLMLKFANLRVL